MTWSGSTKDEILSSYGRLLPALREAKGDTGLLEVFREWDKLKSRTEGESNRRIIAYLLNMADREAEAAYLEFDSLAGPVAARSGAQLSRAFLEDPARAILERAYGTRLTALLENAVILDSPGSLELIQRENEVVARIQTLYGAPSIHVAGEDISAAAARALLSSADESMRKSAFLGIAAWIRGLEPHFLSLFRDLLDIRRRLAEDLGETSFIPVGYRRLRRLDWGPEDALKLRRSIRTYIVPVLARFRQRQARMIGKDVLLPWDTEYYPTSSNGHGFCTDPASLVARMGLLFERLHPSLANYFEHLASNDLLDLEDRPNKRLAAYCGIFPDERKTMIVSNTIGTHQDFFNLSHEFGHAFAAQQSFGIEVQDLRQPGLEVCEVHSIAMEHFAVATSSSAYSLSEASALRDLRFKWSLEQIPFYAAADAFYHELFDVPSIDSGILNGLWARISLDYLPGVNTSGFEDELSSRWMRGDYYSAPFYGIDYAIAEIVALQLLERLESDSTALDSYLRLCRLGGTESTKELFESVGVISPFNPEAVRRVAGFLERALML